MRTLTVPPALSEPAAAELEGTFLDESAFDVLVRDVDGPTTVLCPDGQPLLVYLPNTLSASAVRAAYTALRDAATTSDNRGAASGLGPDGLAKRPWIKADGTVSRTDTTRKNGRAFVQRLRRDGVLSNTDGSGPVRSGIVGYFDRTARFPYCRQTAYTMAHADRFRAAIPLLVEADRLLAQHVPDRHANQAQIAAQTHPDFVIPGTSFTTITVNRNWQTAVHRDVGDLAAGFGVMCAFRAGTFDGGYLVFPRFRVAVDMQTRGLLLADVHQWHGNTPLVGIPGAFDRLSLVLYYRERMRSCGSATQELHRARTRSRGSPLHA